MMIKDLKLTRRRKLLGAVVICAVLIAGLAMLWPLGQVAEAAILTPLNFYDDFSGDLSQWTVVSGTWAIESGELHGEGGAGVSGVTIVIVGLTTGDMVIEARAKCISDGACWNFFITFGYDVSTRKGYRLGARVGESRWVLEEYDEVADTRIVLAFVQETIESDVWHALKVVVGGNDVKLYVAEVLKIDYTFTTMPGGSVGLSGAATHAHFDDVKVSGASIADIPNAYAMNVRAGVTQIIVTCTWSGAGNITIELISPTTTYYESNMSIYEKTTVSFNGTTTSTLNIKRTALSIATTTSSQIWILHLSLSDVTTYQMSVETS